MINPGEKQLLVPEPVQANSKKKAANSLHALRRAVMGFFMSGRLLKALSFVHGLRDPRQAGFWAGVFVFALIVTDLAYAVLRLVTIVICPTLDEDFNRLLCEHGMNIKPIKTMNDTNSLIDKLQMNTNGFVLLTTILAGASAHFAFFFAFLKLERKENTIKPLRDAFVLGSGSFWLRTNSLVLAFTSALISVIFVDGSGFGIAYPWHLVVVLPMWRRIVNCLLFGALMMALKERVKNCAAEIKRTNPGSLDDAIAVHQQLCACVFSTSDTLKPWFAINWVTTVLWGVFCVGNINTRPVPWFSSYDNILIMCIDLFLFLYPCYRAAAVTSKCRQILIDMNMSAPDHWPPGHPFRRRGQLLQFIQYAELTQCGFRIGKTPFGNSYAWISALVALLLGAAKFFYHSK